MPNPSGTNGGQFIPEPPYGDVKRQDMLLREAPISGAPVTAGALNAPRRAGQRGKGKTGQPQQPEVQPPGPQVPPPSYGFQVAQVWAQLAQTPGASPLVQEYAQMAEAAANGS